ncbi:MAG: tyrosine--tRNA ligase [Taibaiella sp.]|nr:tyrosine--tRNA ligase [Taibaiella sp.]
METILTLQQNTAIILPENGLAEKLQQAEKEKRPLVIKLGFDPTAPDLHLGHAVVLKKLRQFQDLGHQVVILVGSFTARIGDPTGKNKSRKPLTAKEVQHNAATYLDQLSKIIDTAKAQIVFNDTWLEQLSFSEVIRLLSNVTLAQLMHRNDFNKRYTENIPIALHELVYPILQGFDSVHIKADIEMGGTDQLFNCTMGRQLQEHFGLDPQIVVCMPLLKGLDGKEKMSKSLNNTIGLIDTPDEMFGKTMSMPDNLIEEFLDLVTDFSSTEKEELRMQLAEGANPMNIKKIIARNIISQYHDPAAAQAADNFFSTQFQSKDATEKVFVPVDISKISKENDAFPLVDLCNHIKQDETRSAIKRLIESGAVEVNHEKITEQQARITLAKGTKIKIGKRTFYELQ